MDRKDLATNLNPAKFFKTLEWIFKRLKLEENLEQIETYSIRPDST